MSSKTFENCVVHEHHIFNLECLCLWHHHKSILWWKTRVLQRSFLYNCSSGETQMNTSNFFIALFMDLLGCIESILRARLLTSLPSLQMVSAVFRSKQQNLKSNTAKQANKMLMHGDISGLLFVCLLFNYLIFPMFCSDHLKFQASLKKSVIQSTSVRSDVATSLHFSYFPQAMLFQQHSIFNETPPNVIGSMQLSQNWQVTKETMYLI